MDALEDKFDLHSAILQGKLDAIESSMKEVMKEMKAMMTMIMEAQSDLVSENVARLILLARVADTIAIIPSISCITELPTASLSLSSTQTKQGNNGHPIVRSRTEIRL